MHETDDNMLRPAENRAHVRTPRRLASSNDTGSRVPHASPPSPTSSDGYVPVEMYDKDRTVVDTTVTASGDDVVSFLREVQKRLLNEVQDQEHLLGLKVKDVEEHSGHIVGLDTEWRHNDQPGEPRHRVAVLQLCVGNQCLIFQIHHADYVPDELKDFLANPEFRFAGVGIGNDVKRLREDCNLQVAKTMDLPKVAADVLCPPEKDPSSATQDPRPRDGQHDGPGPTDLRWAGLKTLAPVLCPREKKPGSAIQDRGDGQHDEPARTDLLEVKPLSKKDLQRVKPLTKKDLQQAGLKTLARVVMGMCIEKPKDVTRSNWAARPLSTEQVRYACIDAFVSYDVGRRLRLEKYAQLASNPEQPSRTRT